MRMDLAAAWAWLNAALESSAFKLLIIPGALGLIGLGRYFGRRKIEKTGESEEIRRARELVDLQRAMKEGGVSIEEINDLRQRLLEKPEKQAVATATYFIERAEYLHERPSLPLIDDDGVLTQAEMNEQAAARFHQADEELTSLLVKKMAESADEEAAALQAAQDAWLQWRDAEASWESKSWEGGSIRPLMVATKLEALTRERIASLEVGERLEQDPGNLEVQHKPTPRDLAEHLEPGVTSARVRELIGAPHFISGNYWFYRFLETQVEIVFEGEVIRDVTFAIIDGEKYQATLSEVNEYMFGALTFGDLLAENPSLVIRHRTSARTHEVYTSIAVGIPGTYRSFYLGAIMPFHGTRLHYTDFDWDFENQSPRGFPTNAIINWFGTTSRFDEEPMASWYIR